MIADIKYLHRMKELEAQLDQGTQEKVLGLTSLILCLIIFNQLQDIVPVSGLIMGTFARYENELKTVLH